MNILILGSEGLIGKALSHYAKTQGHIVLRYDLKIDPIIQDLKTVDTNEEAYKHLCEKLELADYVVFLAWDVGGAPYLQKNNLNSEFIENNMKIMTNTFPLFQKYSSKFIFASTRLSASFSNNLTYGSLKKVGEDWTTSLGGINLRFWNVYGVEDLSTIRTGKSHVITDFILGAFKGDIFCKTDGREGRYFLYDRDAAIAIMSIIDYVNYKSNRQIFDVSSSRPHSIKSVARIIQSKIKCNIWYSDKSAEDDRQSPDCRGLKSIYWQETTTLENGIDKMIDAYKGVFK